MGMDEEYYSIVKQNVFHKNFGLNALYHMNKFIEGGYSVTKSEFYHKYIRVQDIRARYFSKMYFTNSPIQGKVQSIVNDSYELLFKFIDRYYLKLAIVKSQLKTYRAKIDQAKKLTEFEKQELYFVKEKELFAENIVSDESLLDFFSQTEALYEAK